MKELLDAIKSAGSIAIICHVSPDGDTVGSALGLREALKALSKRDITVFCRDVPKSLDFLSGLDTVTAQPDGRVYDLAIAVDCAAMHLMGTNAEVFKAAQNTAVIDHHLSDEGYAQLNFVDSGATSTTQEILRFIDCAGLTLTKDMAMPLYVGLVTDSGNFNYSNTTERALSDAARLVASGIDVVYVTTKLFKRRTLENTRLIGRAIERMELMEDGRLALMVLTADDIKEIGAEDSDFEGIINYAREVDGVEVAALIRQVAQHSYKCSLRSKYYANVAAVGQMFGGGGHERASGCSIKGELDDAKARLIAELKKVL